ncbi:Protein of unknown function [Austwickia chelonae]|uniref:DUF3039 domain-containing protein n=1 Tax=Austwickia chelonae NBRC 105200 TaxID=1184607 RepID=K6VP15_9MICO|nr:DUF3039 domain-containing protein [Austwickia chelonae]GAB77100.1 hypothetical protein AUCHE_05_00040 [Austwickia chelonae NBRC 105200]SEW02796.1 Protein of unknown function [Austwickia chelonae]
MTSPFAQSTPAGPGNDPFDPYGPGGPLGPSTATSVLEREETSVEHQLSEPGDHERFSHYVRKEKILESALSGQPVVALCGKVWVPGRDPQRFPVCPVCKEIYEGLRAPQDGDD